MKKETLKTRVIARLIKNGNNENDVKEMVAEHFEMAALKFDTVKEIAWWIRTVY